MCSRKVERIEPFFDKSRYYWKMAKYERTIFKSEFLLRIVCSFITFPHIRYQSPFISYRDRWLIVMHYLFVTLFLNVKKLWRSNQLLHYTMQWAVCYHDPAQGSTDGGSVVLESSLSCRGNPGVECGPGG